jgi:hypothetical protein
MTTTRTLFVLLASLCLTLGTACGDDSSQGDNNGGAGNNGEEVNADLVPIPEDWEYDSEYELRFTEFKLERDTPGFELNAILDTNISDQGKKYPIVVLVHLKDIDPEAGTLAIRGGAGKKADLSCLPGPEYDGVCEYKWDEQTPESFTGGVPFDAETGEFKAELDSLDFVATFELDGQEKNTIIKVTDLTLDARFPHAYENDNGEVEVETAIKNASLIGLLTEENADASGVQLSAGKEPKLLSELLGKETMNYDRDGDDTMDAWQLKGRFSAEQAVVVE